MTGTNGANLRISTGPLRAVRVAAVAVLVVAVAVTVALLVAQVQATHGVDPCVACGGVVIRGVPLVVWLLPAQVIMAWWRRPAADLAGAFQERG